MKSKDLRERSTEDLRELRSSLKKELFTSRMKNHLGQLDDTSSLGKTRRDIARVEQVLAERARAGAGGAS